MENQLRDLSKETRFDNLGSSQTLTMQNLEHCKAGAKTCGAVDLPALSIDHPSPKDYSETNANHADVATLSGAALSFERNVRDWGKRDIHGLTAVPLAALSGFALYEDGKNLVNSKSFIEGAYAASAALLDATATAAFAISTVPKFKQLGTIVGSVSISARGALAIGDQITK